MFGRGLKRPGSLRRPRLCVGVRAAARQMLAQISGALAEAGCQVGLLDKPEQLAELRPRHDPVSFRSPFRPATLANVSCTTKRQVPYGVNRKRQSVRKTRG